MLTATKRGLFGNGCLLLLLLTQLGQPARAEPERYNGVLRGKFLAPPLETEGLGTVQLAVMGNELSWIVSFYDLESPPVAVQIHGPAGPGENAALQLDLGKNWAPPGHYNIMYGKAEINADQLATLSSGKWYLVVGSETHPEGELRGQLQRFN